MKAVNLHESKTYLSRHVEEALKGHPFIIARAGRAMVKAVPITESNMKTPKRLGFLEGAFTVPDNFDRLNEDEIAAMFYGDDEAVARYAHLAVGRLLVAQATVEGILLLTSDRQVADCPGPIGLFRALPPGWRPA